MQAIRNLFKNSKGGDKSIYASTMILAIFGIIMIGSSSIGIASTKGASTAIRNMLTQAGYVFIGIVAMRFFSKTFKAKNIKFSTSMKMYLTGIISMCLCLFWSIKGSSAWIKLPGGFTIQPAEFMKVIMILVMAYMLTETDAAYIVKGKFRNEAAKNAFYKDKFIKCTVLPMCLVIIVGIVGMFLQKDLGTTIIIMLICFICFMSTPRTYYKKYKKLVIGVIIVGAVILVVLGTTVLQGYQLGRIYTWFNPLEDYYDAGFHLTNSLIAFSNGGLFGLGLGYSTQTFGYIPEAHNDFIGAIVYEELGLFGLALIIIPTCIIIFKLLRYSDAVKDNKSKIILLGVASYFFLQLLVNLGGVSGFIPMTGVPLLLISSGGSSTLSAFIAIGICQSIIRKYNHEKYEAFDTV
ncbi:MAG: FtsW/RodA/SpoVE family cell cycle protein [Coprobacillaceae bacterium]